MHDLERLLGRTLRKKTAVKKVEGKDIEQLCPGGALKANGLYYHRITQRDAHLPVGRCSCEATQPHPILRAYAGLTENSRLCYIDTETTGLAGGTGTYAFMVGVGYLDGTTWVAEQFFLKNLAGESAFLQAIFQLLHHFDAVVSYNGKTFDLPLLRTRAVMNNLCDPTAAMGHLDLLHPVRRLWRTSIDSCTLQNIEAYVLQHHRQLDREIPGSRIPQAYFDYLSSRNATDMELVMAHNQQDILSLAAILQLFTQVLTPPYTGEFLEDPAAVGRLFEEFGSPQQAMEYYHYLQKANALSALCNWQLAMLYKRLDRFDEACILWQHAAANHWQSCIELAKVEEHRTGDFAAALQWTERALALLQSSYFFDSAHVEALNHRKVRLQSRLETDA
jgi:hypothetical protein